MQGLGMQAAGQTTDVRDGCVSNVRTLTRGEWLARSRGSGIPNPHRSPAVLASVLGYDVGESWSAFSSLDADGLRAALLAALARTWPGGELPGEPSAHRVSGEVTDVGTAITADRLEGRVPLLVTVDIDSAEEGGDRLAELYVTTLREGVWLHADVTARHGLHLEGLSRADSIAFDVPSNEGFVRVFVTRHPGMLDPSFAWALAYKGPGSGIG